MIASPPPGQYLVLGATGLVGSHALLALRGTPGVAVRAVSHRRAATVEGDNIQYVAANLLDHSRCDDLMSGVDYVLMFAGVLSTAAVVARDPIEPAIQNLTMTANVMRAAHRSGVRKLVWLSSTTGYPSRDRPIREDEMFDGEPPDAYFSVGWATRYLEKLSETFSTRLKRSLSIVVLRPSMIYGEFDDFCYESAHFLPALIRRVVERRRPIEVWGTGEVRRDLVHASDVIAASLTALQRIDSFDAFNIASGQTWSVNELLHKVITIDGFHDADIAHVAAGGRVPETRTFDTSKARAALCFEPATSIDEGLERTVRWLRAAVAGNSGLARLQPAC